MWDSIGFYLELPTARLQKSISVENPLAQQKALGIDSAKQEARAMERTWWVRQPKK